MDTLQNAIAIAGLASLGALWVFCTVGALSTLWNTFGEHTQGLIERIRKR